MSARAKRFASSSRPLCSESAPQARPWPAGTLTSQPSALSTRIVAALTPGKTCAARSRPPTRRGARRTARRCLARKRREGIAQRDRRRHRGELTQPRRQHGSERAGGQTRQAEDPAQPERKRREHAQPARIRKQRERRTRERHGRRASAALLLRSRAASLRSGIVPTPDGHAVTQASSPDMHRWFRDDRIERDDPVIGTLHQVDAPRGESISSCHELYVGQAGKQKPQCTQSAIRSR